ncbi:hypothetical protein [Geodermatophilus sp. SYSU D00710]
MTSVSAADDTRTMRERMLAGDLVTIGENTVVGAGSVVTRDLPADVVAVGDPARVVRTLERG